MRLRNSVGGLCPAVRVAHSQCDACHRPGVQQVGGLHRRRLSGLAAQGSMAHNTTLPTSPAVLVGVACPACPPHTRTGFTSSILASSAAGPCSGKPSTLTACAPARVPTRTLPQASTGSCYTKTGAAQPHGNAGVTSCRVAGRGPPPPPPPAPGGGDPFYDCRFRVRVRAYEFVWRASSRACVCACLASSRVCVCVCVCVCVRARACVARWARWPRQARMGGVFLAPAPFGRDLPGTTPSSGCSRPGPTPSWRRRRWPTSVGASSWTAACTQQHRRAGGGRHPRRHLASSRPRPRFRPSPSRPAAVAAKPCTSTWHRAETMPLRGRPRLRSPPWPAHRQ